MIMSWDMPIMFLGLVLPVGFLMIALWSDRRATQALFGNRPEVRQRLAPALSLKRRLLRRILLALALAAMVLALVGPRWGEPRSDGSQTLPEVLICLDVSRSMACQDMAPDRLTYAKGEVKALLSHAKASPVGLVAFAGSAELLSPMTTDKDALQETLHGADELSVSTGGTDLGAALSEALTAVASAAGGQPLILLLTDGEDHEGRGLAKAKECHQRGVTVSCAAIGSTRGARIPLPRGSNEPYLRDASGQEVVSAVNPMSLKAISNTTGGDTLAAWNQISPLIQLYDAHLKGAEGSSTDDAPLQPPSKAHWFILAAFGLAALEFALSDRKVS